MMDDRPILLTGATGYVGGRLAPRLLHAGYRVRALVRSPAKVRCRPWGNHPRLEVARADIFDRDSVIAAAEGCRAAYYLVHSMAPGKKDFASLDRRAAENMVIAAGKAKLERIIYLGGLGKEGKDLSEHLRSRLEVARILQSGLVPVTYLRAAMILGSGSASFEILRYLVDRLPVLITPRWVRSPCQPIAIGNVLHYLMGCLESPHVLGQTLDIGGPDVLTYEDLMRIYAQEAGLPRRWIVPVPVLTPRISSYWLHLVTPVPMAVARPLAEGLRNAVVCEDFRIRQWIPQHLLSCRDAIRKALQRIHQEQVDTCWSDAGHLHPPEWVQCGDAPYAGGTVLESAHRMVVPVTPGQVWAQLQGIGGRQGWFFANTLWKIRGWMDQALGGVGHTRGRREPGRLFVGDTVDYWRVLEMEPDKRLLFYAEMKLPGEAILDFRLAPVGESDTEVQVIARFLPRGLVGIGYWYAMLPFHNRIFSGLLGSLARALGVSPSRGPEAFDARLPHACRLEPRTP
ncbi:Uncharacterized conserved protein YbjT, contains NAD(P)-binding and DUF2867 domains [Desulfacinum hydrothermale DSM 13146]|uniref:Uncharacterized conserved protein YbjT, contains NAD(P)-binding and DUF2867 domains n=1 Tax=Desulfacinum hydrothermale DSM 13146 TaxID=1121390 RepID=A0A1W1X478_9BACT|nr:SDR family oxidoreductase [Desulfacinum hydrothermale]SMC18221.1 Uncharacterized conserved protein YbjT, contains NAD(P)-binding and DUF2867 domains [Desulfacinum hydrothermale DSM 13146]